MQTINFENSFSMYEDIIELDIAIDTSQLINVEYNWVKYNPRKQIDRWGCSITSLDGEDHGIPDLDSVLEYNRIYQTHLTEKDFNKRTKHSAPFNYFLDKFDVGRSHYLKLNSGGFFPWHRDPDLGSFRIIYTIDHCEPTNLVWVEDTKVLELNNNRWYYINTKKKHCVFSFNTAIFAVFNVVNTIRSMRELFLHMRIK